MSETKEECQAKFSIALKLATDLDAACGPERTIQDVKEVLEITEKILKISLPYKG
jgi:hypothetical protein